MAKSKILPEQVYGTEIINPKGRSNQPVRSRYMAAVLAMILGIVGVNQFYLRNVVRGILKIIFTLIFVICGFIFDRMFIVLIPVVLSVLTGVIYLCQSDVKFQQKNHVRTV
ncbi:MAG: TM2 domain-containing protein [Clostridiales bacterium]|nr:TM2 domain-containing protein [Clostridiales bacterium]MCD7827040.1 TM2 domain-containing protein [Clostridiales bacterium]